MTEKPLKQSNWKQIVLGLFLLAVCAALLVFLVQTMWKGFVALSPEIATAIIAGSATVLVSVVSLIISRHWERRREIEQEHRKQKLPIYQEFMMFWFKIIMSQKSGMADVSEKEIIQFMGSLTQKLMVWGSDKVLKQYSAFRRKFASLAEQRESHVFEAMLVFEKLLYAIRSDVGHKNKGLGPGDLLALFITDIDKFLKCESTSAKKDQESRD